MDNDKKLYTLLIYTENMVGMLSQVTAVFTRRQVNIESINASASSIEGVHKYTITTWSDEEQVKTITKQIEKKVDVIKATIPMTRYSSAKMLCSSCQRLS